MNFISFLVDRKIHGLNVAAEVTIGDYWQFAQHILETNEYQRRRVRTQGKTYQLLRADLIAGCVMPPIILAVTEEHGIAIKDDIEQAVLNGIDARISEKTVDIILKAANANDLLILDGLQRTLTIKSCIEDIASENILSEEERERFFSNIIRVEFYIGLSKTGILYRMLTLNTGQTPMSFRHQLEILYHDYISNDNLPDGIQIVRESDEKRARGSGKYKYHDIIDMFYAYSTGSPMPFDKQALITEMREMQFLEDYRYDSQSDHMQEVLITYNYLLEKLDDLAGDWHYTGHSDSPPEVARPFGTTLNSIFSRPQAMAGFGAECKRLFQNGSYEDFQAIRRSLDGLHFSEEPDMSLSRLVVILDQIASRAKKIGDAQRVYFQYAFRRLLLPDSNSFRDLSSCWLEAQENYEMMY